METYLKAIIAQYSCFQEPKILAKASLENIFAKIDFNGETH